jgi:hypothetical protein
MDPGSSVALKRGGLAAALGRRCDRGARADMLRSARETVLAEKFPRLSAIITEVPNQGFRVTVHLWSSPDDEVLLTDEPIASAEEATLLVARHAVAHDIPTEQIDVSHEVEDDAGPDGRMH